jgi:predicted TPR repeat methyltransferase
MPANSPRKFSFDSITAAAVALFAMAMVAVPPPDLDLWWLMAVGRRIAETHAYIYHDPFTFTVPGAPWSPQSWMSALVYYGLFHLGGMSAIAALRVVMVGLITALVFRAQRAGGVAWAVASPLVVVAILTAHGRLTDRGQLFEYLFLAWLLAFLLTSHARKGRAFFVWPLLVQLAWVQFHSSFLLGPALAAIYFGGEWVAVRLPFARPLFRHDYRRAALLVGLMLLVCVINPNPRAFLIQPFDAGQHELISRFTLEWKSPFDPAIAGAGFHPWYEILLAVAALAILAALPRVPLAPALMMIATAWLSLQSHRFRVEFALVTAVMASAMFARSALVGWIAARRVPASAWRLAGMGVTLVLIVLGQGRLARTPAPDLLPERALAFVADEDVARRPFHPIGYGSYMLWDLYGKRQTFIDGRNFDAGVYEDFLRGQTGAPLLRGVVQKYRVDSFIIPAPERADAGMRNVHQSLVTWGAAWDLVHMDEEAFVYVARASADSVWLDQHAFRAYHPLTFAGAPHSAEQMEAAAAELERLTRESPDYAHAWMDLGLVRLTHGDAPGAMAAFGSAVAIDTTDAVAWNQLGQAAGAAGDFDRAVAAFTALTRLVPANPLAYVNLARAEASAGNMPAAVAACERALALDPNQAQARQLMQSLRGSR